MKLADNCLVQFCHLSYRLQGRSQDFSKGEGRSQSHRGYSPLLSLVYQRAQSYYRGMKAHIN